jgi:outer membrane protein OmpA-like peptidoglycan-associated protein
MLVLLFISGCFVQKSAKTMLDETQEQVNQARGDFEAIQNLQVKQKYSDDFTEAEVQLSEAESHLQELEALSQEDTLLKKPEAIQLYLSIKRSAQKSRAASQRILRQYYLDTIIPIMANAETKLDTIVEQDAEHPLGELRPVIDNISMKIDRIERDQEVLTLTEVIDDINMLVEANAIMESNIQQTIEADAIVFEKGKFAISEQGKQQLENIVEQILAVKTNVTQEYPDKTVAIQITTVGYTDQLDFRWASDALETLTQNLNQKVPTNTTERREFLNQRLSELRARVVNEYLTQRILHIDANAKINQEIIGKGEQLPPGVSPPYPISDPRRRICKMYSYVILE